MGPEGGDRANLILVLTPAGRDSEMVRDRLGQAGIATEPCADAQAVLAGIRAGAGAALIAQEALSQGATEDLLSTLDAQEPWSDLPVLLLTETPSRGGLPAHVAPSVLERANVTLLPRPIRVEQLVSAVRTALRARRRQYQTRSLLEDLRRAVELGDLFVSILGHDLRTPLSAIVFAAHKILRGASPTETRSASIILSSADRMNRMIAQLLDLARARQVGGIPLAPGASDLAEIARSVVNEMKSAFPGARVLLHEAGSLAGEWDSDRLAQIVSNLVANAVQHGVAEAPVTMDLDGSEPSAVRLRVHNQGAVPPSVLPTIFDAFKPPSIGSERGTRKGLGLGLFIARELAQAHGGDVSVRSSDQEGTTFEVVLPRHLPP